MCTVTYIPKNDGSFILTHNRDESVRRPVSSPPIKKIIDGNTHIYPIDPQGKGTWVGVSESGRIASLLNGGDTPYDQKPPYRHSRGLIIPEYFKYPSFEVFYSSFNFKNIEPFTLLVFEQGKIYKTIHNIETTEVFLLDSSKPHLFMSYSLYPPDLIEKRNLDFQKWYHQQKEIIQGGVVGLHRSYLYETTEGAYDPGEGHILQTVSITSIHRTAKKAIIDYFDLVNDIHMGNSLSIKTMLAESA